MSRSRLNVDFNELVESGLVLLSKTDEKADHNGHLVSLRDGLEIEVYEDDLDELERPCRLVADGRVERNTAGGWTSAARWCCRIDEHGIRHEYPPGTSGLDPVDA